MNQDNVAQSTLCIPWYQNSGTQAPIISALVRNCKITQGSKVLVHIEGGCGAFTKKRTVHDGRSLQRRQGLQISGTNSSLLNPYGDGSLTYVATDLGVLQGGHYDLQVNLGGQIDNVTVLDNDGDVYAR